MSLWQWFLHVTGSDNTSGIYYGFWSGFGSDLGEVTLLAAIVIGFRRINCHVRHCWRIGKYEVKGTPYKVCRKHHPDVPTGGVTHEELFQ